jgi:tRNA pseudouridine32 synthase/23S rRNA pseudouridine746 synthase
MSSSSASKPLLRNGVSPSKVGVPAKTDTTALEFLAHRFPAISREVWLQRFLEGSVFNALGRKLGPEHCLLDETHLLYFRHVADEPALPFKANVIYRDDYLVVADKPHFMPVTPGGKYLQQSLLVQLKQELNLPDLSPLHRIDRETAGLVLFSVRAQDRNAYQEQFRLRQVQKTYEAVADAPASSKQKLQFPITYRSMMVTDAQFFKMRELAATECDPSNPFNSETWIDCVESLEPDVSASSASKQSLKSLAKYIMKPVTGQRHQLRVHMNALGLPILHDQFYPTVKKLTTEEDDFEQPLQLLAKSIAFLDPLTGQTREFKSELKLQH